MTDEIIELRIPYPRTAAGRREWSRRFGLNAYYSGKHWAQRKSDAEYWHGLVAAELRRQRLRARPFAVPVVVSFWWNDRLDIDNHAAMGKMIVDALKGKLIADDDRRHVVGLEHWFHERDEIVVKIVPISGI